MNFKPHKKASTLIHIYCCTDTAKLEYNEHDIANLQLKQILRAQLMKFEGIIFIPIMNMFSLQVSLKIYRYF